jgi:hypothetical protein
MVVVTDRARRCIRRAGQVAACGRACRRRRRFGRAGEVVAGRRSSGDVVLLLDAAGSGEDGAQLLLGLLVGVEVLLTRL